MTNSEPKVTSLTADVVEASRFAFVGESMKIERDVLLHELTDDEQRALITAALTASPLERLVEDNGRLKVALVQAAIPLEALLICRTLGAVDLAETSWAEIENGVSYIRTTLAHFTEEEAGSAQQAPAVDQ